MKELLKNRQRLINHFNFLLLEYRELQKFFINRIPEGAEMSYYNEKFMDSGYDSEGLFCLGYRGSLKNTMKENRKERNETISKIKMIKNQIKEINKINK